MYEKITERSRRDQYLHPWFAESVKATKKDSGWFTAVLLMKCHWHCEFEGPARLKKNSLLDDLWISNVDCVFICQNINWLTRILLSFRRPVLRSLSSMSSRWITHYFMHEEDFYLSPLLHPERMISSKSLLSLFSCCIFFCQGFASVNSSAGTTAFRPRRCCKGVKKGTSSVSAEFLAHPVIRYTVTDERRFVMVGSSVQTIRIPDSLRQRASDFK